MNVTFAHAGGKPLVIVHLRENSFGHQVVEILMGLHLAFKSGGAVTFRPPRALASTVLLLLRCVEVPIRPYDAASRLALMRSRLGAIVSAASWPGRLRDAFMRAVLKRLGGTAEDSGWITAIRRAAKRRIAPLAKAPSRYLDVDFRERHARHQLTVQLTPDVVRQAERDAAALGVGPETRVVTVHIRESGFKAATHVADTAFEQIRNAPIDSYCHAFDELVAQGYRVVRIGDPSMRPFRREGVLDLATSPERTDALEFFLVARSECFIATDAGPFCLPLLTKTPCLGTNITDLVGAYPFRAFDRGLVKRVFDRNLGRTLTLREMLTEEYFLHRKDLSRFSVIDNSPEDLTLAVREMLTVLRTGPTSRSPAQDEYHRLAEALQNSPAAAKRRVRKGEPAVQFLGDGAICHGFAARYLDTAEAPQHEFD